MEGPSTSFTKTLTESYVRGSGAVQIPKPLRDLFCPQTADWTLVDAAGNEWEGKISVGSKRACLTGGWGPFKKANRVEVGDTATFELQQGNRLLITLQRGGGGGAVQPAAAAQQGKRKAKDGGQQPKQQQQQGKKKRQSSSKAQLAAVAAAEPVGPGVPGSTNQEGKQLDESQAPPNGAMPAQQGELPAEPGMAQQGEAAPMEEQAAGGEAGGSAGPSGPEAAGAGGSEGGVEMPPAVQQQQEQQAAGQVEQQQQQQPAEQTPESYIGKLVVTDVPQVGWGKLRVFKWLAEDERFLATSEQGLTVLLDESASQLAGLLWSEGCLVGSNVSKDFGGVAYGGSVLSYDSKSKWYRVRYSDGDSEELDEEEVLTLLVDRGPPKYSDKGGDALKRSNGTLTSTRPKKGSRLPQDSTASAGGAGAKRKAWTRQGEGSAGAAAAAAEAAAGAAAAAAAPSRRSGPSVVPLSALLEGSPPAAGDASAGEEGEGAAAAAAGAASEAVAGQQQQQQGPYSGTYDMGEGSSGEAQEGSQPPATAAAAGPAPGGAGRGRGKKGAAGGRQGRAGSARAEPSAAGGAAPAAAAAAEAMDVDGGSGASGSGQGATLDEEGSGAGHTRGVQAYDSKAGRFRPIGPWIADPKTGTLLGRRQIDRRHLADRQPGSANEKHTCLVVPGWVGVRTSEEVAWSPTYQGKYCPVLWDTSLAVKLRVTAAECGTVEEAARMYDRIALAYYGPEAADTNYPHTPELLASLGEKEANVPRSIIPCALRLLGIEQSISYSALSEDSSNCTDGWSQWERKILDEHATRFPHSNSAQELALELKWLLEQLKETAIMPAWRGQRLREFLAACGECSGAGGAKDHYWPKPAGCQACADQPARKAPAAEFAEAGHRSYSVNHGSRSLLALLRTANDHVMCHAAMDVYQEEDGDDSDAEAAAQEAQAGVDERLGMVESEDEEAGEEEETSAAAVAGAGRKRKGAAQPGQQQGRKKKPKQEGRQQQQQAQQKSKAAAAAAARRQASAEGEGRGRGPGGANARLPPGLRVIVIGAGMSGLKAAADLQAAGAEVTVLEARDRIGGRINSHVLSHGDLTRTVDLGATFICGTDTTPPVNPLLTLAQKLGLTLKPKVRHGIQGVAIFDRSGQRLPEEVQVAAEAKFEEEQAEVMTRAEQLQKGNQKDLPMNECLKDILDNMEMTDMEREICECFNSDLYATTLDNLSLKGSVSNGYSGDHELVLGGYKQMVEAVMAGKTHPTHSELRDVRLQHVVKSVRLVEGGGVEVEVEGQAEPLRSHAVVVTLPLGVLQSGRVEFCPPLPEFKEEALGGLAMGTENRVAMLFEKPFWPEEPHFLRPLGGKYTYANTHALGVTNTLCAWIRPEFVPEVEEMSDEETMADVEASLKHLFPDTYQKPLTYTVTRWKKDPCACGAYSHVPPGGRKAYYDWMAWPVSGDAQQDAAQPHNSGKLLSQQTRLFFAGEATHREDAYTVQGALLSGRREANIIKKWWKAFHSQILQQQQETGKAEEEPAAAVKA